MRMPVRNRMVPLVCEGGAGGSLDGGDGGRGDRRGRAVKQLTEDASVSVHPSK